MPKPADRLKDDQRERLAARELRRRAAEAGRDREAEDDYLKSLHAMSDDELDAELEKVKKPKKPKG